MLKRLYFLLSFVLTLTVPCIAQSGRESGLEVETPQKYGAICDGTSRTLSTVYATLEAAQKVYPFVTSLKQQLDYAGLQKMSNESLGWNGSEHGDANARLNKLMFIPAGKCQLGSDVWLIRNASGINLRGAGRRASILQGSGPSVFRTDGLWYSHFEGLGFESTGEAIATVDIDGNVPRHPYETRGVQANTFKDCKFEGGGRATYAFALTRLGNPPGPGAQGSENLFLNCHFEGSTFANFYSTGYNALQNTFIGGNFQSYQKHGIYIVAGSIYLFSVGFQSTYGYQQIINDGYDINADSGGVDDRITVIGCRSESLRFYRGGSSQPPVLIGNRINGSAAARDWSARRAYSVNQYAVKTSATLGPRIYVITTAGTSGTSEPVWPDSGTVSDGTAVWTMMDFDAIKTAASYLISNSVEVGFVSRTSMIEAPTREITTDTVLSMNDELVLCNNTKDITVTLPMFTGTGNVRQKGKRYTIKKALPNSATITIKSADGGNLDGETTAVTILGGTRGYVTVELAGGGDVPARHWIVARSVDIDSQFRGPRANRGTGLKAEDFVLSPGFGTTASVTVAKGTRDARGTITIRSAGKGQAANPTITLTFKSGAWADTPFAVVSRSGGAQLNVPVSVESISPTTLVIRFNGTPVAAETYTLTFFVDA